MKLRILRLHLRSPKNVNCKNEKAINEQQKKKLKIISISTKSAKSQWNYTDYSNSSFYYC